LFRWRRQLRFLKSVKIREYFSCITKLCCVRKVVLLKHTKCFDLIGYINYIFLGN
jgi:hypothetical protein